MMKLNRPAKPFADLDAAGQKLLRILIMSCVPKMPDMSEEDHIAACIPLIDGGLLWFDHESPMRFRMHLWMGGLGRWVMLVTEEEMH